MMNTRLRRIIKPFILAAMFLVILIFVWPSSGATGGIRPSISGSNLTHHTTMPEQKANILKILLVLDNQMIDKPLLEKAKNKLLTLSDRQIVLISSLCERIAYDGHTTRTDIAFLLITALIILS